MDFDVSGWKYLLLALFIGIFLGWYFFRGSSSPSSHFNGLSPLVDQLSTLLKGDKDAEVVSPPKQPPEFNRPKVMSRGEEECGKAAVEVFGVPFKKARPKWLVNPKTGSRMEIDWYNDTLKIGIEYNGRQHYFYTETFHRSEEEFILQKERDKDKLDLCDKNGVYLITVPYTVPLHKIKDYIAYYHPDRRAERLLNGETGSAVQQTDS